MWRLVLVFQHDDKIVIFSELAQSRHCHSSSIASFRRYSVIRLGGFVMSKNQGEIQHLCYGNDEVLENTDQMEERLTKVDDDLA